MAGHGRSAGLGPCGVGVTTKPPTALMTFVIPGFQKTGPPTAPVTMCPCLSAVARRLVEVQMSEAVVGSLVGGHEPHHQSIEWWCLLSRGARGRNFRCWEANLGAPHACGANPMVIPSIHLPVGTPTLGGEQVWPRGRGGVWGQVCMVAPSRPPSLEEDTQERADAQCPAGCEERGGWARGAQGALTKPGVLGGLPEGSVACPPRRSLLGPPFLAQPQEGEPQATAWCPKGKDQTLGLHSAPLACVSPASTESALPPRPGIWDAPWPPARMFSDLQEGEGEGSALRRGKAQPCHRGLRWSQQAENEDRQHPHRAARERGSLRGSREGGF